MAKLPPMRTGQIVKIRARKLDFSFWPMRRSSRRWGLARRIFATEPWPLLRRAIPTQINVQSRVEEARAYLDQSKDFFNAASSAGVTGAKPLLLYYSFLNLAKSFILTKSPSPPNLENAYHGLSESSKNTGTTLTHNSIYAHPSSAGNINIFHEIWKLLTTRTLSSKTVLPISQLIPQVVSGHRLWAKKLKEERFVSVEELRFIKTTSPNRLWLRLAVEKGDLRRMKVNQSELIERARLKDDWQRVKDPNSQDDLLLIESKTPVKFSHRAADEIQTVVSKIKPKLWATVTSSSPHRKFYLYLQKTNEPESSLLPQLLSVYAITFFLGSVSRYRPTDFHEILDGDNGAWIESFLADQPNQLLYLLTSEFTEQEVAPSNLA